MTLHSFVKNHSASLRVAFLLGILAYLLYAYAWFAWRDSVSHGLGIVLFIFSWPWSLVLIRAAELLMGWFDPELVFRQRGWIFPLAVAIGCGVNLMLCTALVIGLKNRFQPVSQRGPDC